MLQIAGRPIHGVAFDLEGTVVDLEPLHFAAHLESAKSVGVNLNLDDPRTFTEFVPHFIGGPHDVLIEEILDLAIRRGLQPELHGETRDAKLQELDTVDRGTYLNLRNGLDEIPPREGFLEFYEQIKDLGLPTAIGSLTGTEDAHLILRKSGLDQLFEPSTIVLKEDVIKVKPNPEVYLKTAEKMSINPRNQLVFEDSHNGVKAAREAGSLAIGMPTINRSEVIQRLANEGTQGVFLDWRNVTVDSLRSIEGPRHSLEGKPSRKER